MDSTISTLKSNHENVKSYVVLDIFYPTPDPRSTLLLPALYPRVWSPQAASVGPSLVPRRVQQMGYTDRSTVDGRKEGGVFSSQLSLWQWAVARLLWKARESAPTASALFFSGVHFLWQPRGGDSSPAFLAPGNFTIHYRFPLTLSCHRKWSLIKVSWITPIVPCFLPRPWPLHVQESSEILEVQFQTIAMKRGSQWNKSIF